MAKETQKGSAAPEQYGSVVQRLEEVVARLEGGTLSLEDSLTAFEEGIQLVRRGEQLLTAAEQRIEQLLVVDGRDAAVPLEVAARTSLAAPTARKASTPAAEEDVSF